MKRIITLILCIVLVVLCGLFFFNQSEPIKTAVFRSDNGFGYSIMANNKILIKQNYIPAIKNKIAFCTETDAQLVADFVKHKFIKKTNPSVSLEELKTLKIRLNCVITLQQ